MTTAMGTEMTTEQQSAQVAQLFKVLLRMSKLPSREVEQQLGVSTGYLSYLLSGKAGLKLTHVLDLSRILKIHPHELFALALAPTGASLSPGLRELQGMMPHLVPAVVAAPPEVSAGPSREELEEKLQAAFSETLHRVLEEIEEATPSWRR
jgi:hypothetical protein